MKSERSRSKSRQEGPCENTDSSDSAGRTKRSSLTFISAAEDGLSGVAKKVRQRLQRHSGIGGGSTIGTATPPKFEPDDYTHAKKKLKKAVLECYR